MASATMCEASLIPAVLESDSMANFGIHCATGSTTVSLHELDRVPRAVARHGSIGRASAVGAGFFDPPGERSLAQPPASRSTASALASGLYWIRTGMAARRSYRLRVGDDGPPVVEKHFERPPHRNPSANREAFAQDLADALAAEKAADEIAESDCRGEREESDDQTGAPAAKQQAKPLPRHLARCRKYS